MRHDALPALMLWLAAILGLCHDRAHAAPVRALTVEGHAIEGAWLGMHDDQLKLSVEGREVLLEPGRLMGLHWIATTSRPAPPRAVATAPAAEADEAAPPVLVTLADGSRFPARIGTAQAENITLATDLDVEFTVPLSRVAGVRFGSEPLDEADKAYTQALNNRDAAEDVLILAQDGKVNTLRGLLESLDAQGGTFNWRGRSVPVDRSRLFGVILARGAGVPPAPPVRCILNDESVWAGRLVGGDTASVRLELTAGPTLNIPVDLLDDIRFRNRHLTFLSDLEAASYEFTPWGTTRWPYRKDRSVANRPLRLGGQVFDRGIGMHSHSELTYSLNEPYHQFAATVGIDDAVGSRGNVVFRVLVDDREAFNSGPVTGRDNPVPVLVELNGAKTIKLVVEFGEELDIGDQANWGSARLIK